MTPGEAVGQAQKRKARKGRGKHKGPTEKVRDRRRQVQDCPGAEWPHQACDRPQVVKVVSDRCEGQHQEGVGLLGGVVALPDAQHLRGVLVLGNYALAIIPSAQEVKE